MYEKCYVLTVFQLLIALFTFAGSLAEKHVRNMLNTGCKTLGRHTISRDFVDVERRIGRVKVTTRRKSQRGNEYKCKI